ncbi:MAG TPA: DUF4132 domain-containing protein [Myxococcales bacterium]
MRRFEFVEGTSSKFWEIEQNGTQLTVRFGRIGSNGQTQLKSFGSDEAAAKEQDKLIAEKTKKGYSETAANLVATAQLAAAQPPAAKPKPASAPKPVAAPAPAPAPAPPARSTPSTPSTQSTTAPTATAPTASAPTTPASAAEEDVVHWNDALRKRVFPRRGGIQVQVSALASPKKLWERVQKAWGFRSALVSAAIARTEAGHEIFSALATRIAAAEPSMGPVDHDAALLALLSFCPTYSVKTEHEAGLESLIAAGGLAHATRTALAALEVSVEADGKTNAARLVAKPSSHWGSNFHDHGRLLGLPRLRALLAVAPEADYTAARDAAAAMRATDAQKAASTFLFPTEKAWLASDLPLVTAHANWSCLLASVCDPALLTHLKFGGSLYSNRWMECDEDVGATLVDGCGLGAAEFLAAQDGGYADAELLRLRFSTIGALGCDAAMKHLIGALEKKEAQAALADASALQPRRALRLMSEAAVTRGKVGDLCRSLLASTVRRFPALAAEVAATVGPESARVLQALLAETAEVAEEAKPDELPRVLADPPWLRTKKAAAPVVLANLPGLDVQPAVKWAEGEREEWTERKGYAHGDVSADECLRIVNTPTMMASVEQLADCPEGLAEQLAPRATITRWSDEAWCFRIAARHELKALAFFKARLESELVMLLPALLPLGVPEFAPQIASAMAQKKTARADARAWMLRHPEHATAGLLPVALGKLGKARQEAEAALRLLSASGHEKTVLEIARRAGAEGAIAGALSADPLDLVPAKLPKLPSYASAGALPRPLLRARKACLPASASEALLTMLSFSTLEEPYGGIAQVKQACDPASLARFAWDLFQAWLMNGANSKEIWCLNAVGLLGDDDCARRLARFVRDWPGEAAHARAVAGLDVLAAIGTDVALMHLNGIALKVKFKGLQNKAAEKIESIAETRGLTREELEDRLAPDLGLDEDGSMALDFGPRTFRVGFDEQLRPFARDADGSRLKDLPKPKQSDDAEKAGAAAAKWSQLKKDAKTAASLQILRLELAMCGQRRFAPGDFLELFVRHPLVFHVVRRLVWASYDEKNKVAETFRVAEDRTLADAEDAAFALPEGAKVGIPHPLELEASVAGRWSQVLGDYEIVQPFQQLGRPTYAATQAERQEKKLDRVKGLKLPTGKVLGLEQRRWRRGAPQDGGVACWMEKPLPGGLMATLDLDPGLYTGMLSESPEQTLGDVTVGKSVGWWNKNGIAPGTLDPIVFSELVADLERLRG